MLYRDTCHCQIGLFAFCGWFCALYEGVKMSKIDKQSRRALLNIMIWMAVTVLALFIIYWLLWGKDDTPQITVTYPVDSVEMSNAERDEPDLRIWEDANVRYYSYSEVKNFTDDDIKMIDKVIFDRAGCNSEDSEAEIEKKIKNCLNSYEYYNYKLLDMYLEESRE